MLPILPVCAEPVLSETTRELVSCIGRVLIDASNIALPQDLAKSIKSDASTVQISVVVNNEWTIDDLISILDAGAEKIVCTDAQTTELLKTGVDGSRIVVKDTDIEGTSGVYLGGSATGSNAEELAQKLRPQVLPAGDIRRVYVAADASVLPHDSSVAAVYVVPTCQLSRQVIANFVVGSLSSDRQDGLYPTVVVDKFGMALGLVYSSNESIVEAIKTGTGVYQSRKRGLWHKGATSGAVQKLISVDFDCDSDCVKFVVDQTAPGFCHQNTHSCFGHNSGVNALEATLVSRKASAPAGSYTARLFSDKKLLNAKIMEEAEELCEATSKDDVAWEAADLVYFALTKCVESGVSWADVQQNLDKKSLKITRREGDAKPKWANGTESTPAPVPAPANETANDAVKDLTMARVSGSDTAAVAAALTRPIQKTADIMKLVTPIVEAVKTRGDAALLELTEKFDKVKLQSPVLNAPFPESMMQLDDEIKQAIDLSISNVSKFHSAQISGDDRLAVETAPGVICSRFSRPIASVGLYVPGGTAVLPSTAIHLGTPAMVAGCSEIVVASPPRQDGSITPEVVYVAHKIGASKIVLAGGAQAVAAMAYGTDTVPKVDKIVGPGNQFVTAAKMFVQNDTSALVSIDMPAGPSEVLVIADKTANPAFVASDLLSQAEHGVDSQVILLAVDLSESELAAIEQEVYSQAMALPRVEIVRGALAHSTTISVGSIKEAMDLSNRYAPEHLILQVANASQVASCVDNAGSIFVGAWSPESCGDYSSGTNHTLPTYGYARMYSGVNTSTFQKHITSQELSEEGLRNIGPAVMALAAREGLDGHRNAVKVRLESL